MFSDDQFEKLGFLIVAAVVLWLSFAAPMFVAQQTGYEAKLEGLIAWAQTLPNWQYLPLLLLYGLIGFFAIVIVASVIFTLGYMLYKAICEITFWIIETVRWLIAMLVQGLWWLLTAMIWLLTFPVRFAAEHLWHGLSLLGSRIGQAITEAQELRRIYRQEYRDQFPSYRAFKAAFDEAKADRGFLASLARKREVAMKFDAREFDNAGRACPYCGNDRLVVDCSECHEATCGGTIRVLANGEEQHTCHPDCGHVALLGPATHITGGKADRRGVLGGGGHKALGPAGSKLLLSKKETKALPKGGFPLLGGPKKR